MLMLKLHICKTIATCSKTNANANISKMLVKISKTVGKKLKEAQKDKT